MQNMPNQGHVRKWNGKHKGRALKLRLEKHRHIQIAVTKHHTPNGSPIAQLAMASQFPAAVDAQFQTENDVSESSVSSPVSSIPSLGSKSSSTGESSISSNSGGSIWKEVMNETNITALAINRVPFDSSFTELASSMLATGDESGTIIITQITDEEMQKIGDEESADSLLESIMDLGSGALEFSVESRVRSLHFSGSEHLVAGGDGCYAWISAIMVDQSSKTLQEIKVIQKIERIDRIYAVRFSPKRNFLAVGGFDGRVATVPTTAMWKKEDAKTKEDGSDDSFSQVMNDSIIELDRPGLIYCLDWSPEGDYLAIAGSDKVCGIYDASTFQLVHETASRSSAIEALQWSHDGKYFAIGDREVAIVDGKPPFEIQCEISHPPKSSVMAQFRYRITSLCWCPSGSFLAIGGSDGRCLIVEKNSWTLVYEHNRTECINALEWFQQYLIVSDNNHTLAFIKIGEETQSSEALGDHASVTSSSYFSQSTTSSNWVLREDEFRDLEEVTQKAPKALNSRANITSVAFSKVGKASKTSPYLAYAADDCSLTIMTTRDWKAVYQVEFAKPIRSLVFSNSSNYLALGGDEGVLNVLSVRSRTMILNSILSSSITSIAFSVGDERLGVGMEDGMLALLWPTSNWESVGEIDQNESSVICQDWTSRYLACGRMDGSVALFDTEQIFSNFFVPIAEFTSNHPTRSVAFTKSGEFLSIAGDDGVVSILRAKDGWIISNKINFGCSILSTKWSPDGHYIVFSGSSETFLVCDTRTWTIVTKTKEIGPSIFTNNASSISCVDWSLDNKWVAIGGKGSGMHLLNTTDWTLLESSENSQILNN
ncbi:unnamed protein product [Pseudo-nitzschia multistriata]|uniref:Anaphase-promoting complex subunit 4-like WD40 domain-containing protein n=1 Tax=Pseudo-nitzschia multistriata TaxID=183589 RepID=A0A448YYV5_9STRA|nr:unnamed protein product [Pseudo-nitzschia multistriata]